MGLRWFRYCLSCLSPARVEVASPKVALACSVELLANPVAVRFRRRLADLQRGRDLRISLVRQHKLEHLELLRRKKIDNLWSQRVGILAIWTEHALISRRPLYN